MNCKTCKYWKPFVPPERVDEGKCRRYPPIRAEGRAYKYGLYPVTTEDMWCGEYEMAHACISHTSYFKLARTMKDYEG